MTSKKKKSKPRSIVKSITPLPDQSAGEVKVIYEEKPPTNKNQKIYDLPILPDIPRGKRKKDKHPDDEANIE